MDMGKSIRARKSELPVSDLMAPHTRNHKEHRSPNGLPLFSRFARWISFHTGRPSAFLLAAFVVLVWAITGPLFNYSDTWQLVINTGTTIVTFLMVFLIQNTQNRDSQALHMKLDELIRAVSGARNGLIDLDELTDEELSRIQNHYAELARKSKNELRELKDDVVTFTRAAKEKR
jgi:low affinity Fe/Cu permease